MTSFLERIFLSPSRRYVIISLLVLGIVLMAVGLEAVGRSLAMPKQPPHIEALLVTADRHGHCYLKTYSGGYYVGKGQKYDIECVVAVTDSQLSYQWSCHDGEVSEVSVNGSIITWTAPDISVRTMVAVTVSDTANHAVSANVSLSVVSCSVCTFGPCTG